MKTKTILTCPQCREKQNVRMSIDACQYRYTCIHCQAVLTAESGDCCVFCSFADTRCSPKQKELLAAKMEKEEE